MKNKFYAATLSCLCGLMPIIAARPINDRKDLTVQIEESKKTPCKSIIKHIHKQSLPASKELIDNNINSIEGVYNWLLERSANINIYGYDNQKNVITDNEPYCIPQGARVFPICQAGINRSQVLYKVLDNMYGETIDLFYPHGAEKGFDPYCGNFDTFLWIINNLSFAKKQFEAAFDGIGRVPRIYEEYAKNNPINCDETRELFTKAYYQLTDSKTPHVFIVFKQAASIVVTRIMEANYQVKDLSNLTIIILNYDDWIHNPKLAIPTHNPIWLENKTTPKKYSCESYQRFARVIKQHFIHNT